MSKSILSSVMMITRYKRISTTACVKNPINISLTSSPPCFLINTFVVAHLQRRRRRRRKRRRNQEEPGKMMTMIECATDRDEI